MDLAINEKTKIPLVWIFIFIPAIIGVILYVSDFKSDIKITSVKVENLDHRQNVLEEDLKVELRRMSDKLDKINDILKKEK